MFTNPPSEPSSDDEPLEDIMSELTDQMEKVAAMSKTLDKTVIDLYKRTKRETTDWMSEPLKPRPIIKKWCKDHGLSSRPTMNEFIDACFAAALSVDLETRTLTFQKEEAVLWGGKRRLTVFDIIGLVPTLFE